MMAIKSFRDPVSGVLKAWGHVVSNALGDIAQDEPDAFNLAPGQFKWNGSAWVAIPQATLDSQTLQNRRTGAQTTLAAVDDATAFVLRAIVLVVVDQLNVVRAALPTPLPSITPAQARAVIIAKIQAGTADS